MKTIIYILILFVSVSAYSQAKNNQTITLTDITEVRVYPNPFNNKTTISFFTPNKTDVTFIVQNLLGKIVSLDKMMAIEGTNTIPFYRKNLTAGIYIYTLKTNDKVVSKRFVIK